MTDPEDSIAIETFFKAGISIEDLPALFPLLRAREALQAFITLFRGGNEEVLVRLMVLREIGSRGDLPQWSPQQLRQHFGYFDPTKLETVLGRLSANHLLIWDSESGQYQVSPDGRMALAALTSLLKFSEEGGELGYITAQLAASNSVDRVSAEELQHMLARLIEYQDMFDRAVISGSEYRIRKAERKLETVYGWVQKGTEVLRIIAADADLDTAAHQVAHRIGQAQSRMLRMHGVFQRTLTQLESQQVHLGASGLSSADITRWLRTKRAESLAELATGVMATVPWPAFVLGDIALDAAEYELIDKERLDTLEEHLPPPLDAPVTNEVVTDDADLADLKDWVSELQRVRQAATLADIVPARNFELSAYRMSMLALLGDPQSQALEGLVAELTRSNLRVEFCAEAAVVNRHGVAEMTAGQIKRSTKDDGA